MYVSASFSFEVVVVPFLGAFENTRTGQGAGQECDGPDLPSVGFPLSQSATAFVCRRLTGPSRVGSVRSASYVVPEARKEGGGSSSSTHLGRGEDPIDQTTQC